MNSAALKTVCEGCLSPEFRAVLGIGSGYLQDTYVEIVECVTLYPENANTCK